MIQVDVELKRIQTFLFQVPRLKAMLGANALVGEVMRVKLAELARGPISSGLPENFDFADYPDDPLKQLGDEALRDDPAFAYGQGILARDGGHFSALFETEQNADLFMEQAEVLISNELPGVLFELRKKEFGKWNESKSSDKLRTEAIAEIPVLQICTATGQGPATSSNKKEYLSHSAELRQMAGQRFYEGKTQDIIGLLKQSLQIGDAKQPDDLNDIADGGYLALIHADGNSIGNRYQEWKKSYKGENDPLLEEAYGEKFFHSMRVVVRKAVVHAIAKCFSKQKGSAGQRLYQPLMLGGDDLVMVCRADLALAFCRQFCECIEKYPLADGKALTLGIGVAIAKADYPFYRLNELAEELASSAKRLARGQTEGQQASVIDWQVVSQSSFSDLAATRQRADFIQYRVGDAEQAEKTETLLLSQKPYRVLKNEQFPMDSLAELLDAAELLRETSDAAARSALRGLRNEYEKGRLHGGLTFANLVQDNREALSKAGIKQAWYEHDDYCSTPLFDLIELTELPRLGKRKSK